MNRRPLPRLNLRRAQIAEENEYCPYHHVPQEIHVTIRVFEGDFPEKRLKVILAGDTLWPELDQVMRWHGFNSQDTELAYSYNDKICGIVSIEDQGNLNWFLGSTSLYSTNLEDNNKYLELLVHVTPKELSSFLRLGSELDVENDSFHIISTPFYSINNDSRFAIHPSDQLSDESSFMVLEESEKPKQEPVSELREMQEKEMPEDDPVTKVESMPKDESMPKEGIPFDDSSFENWVGDVRIPLSMNESEIREPHFQLRSENELMDEKTESELISGLTLEQQRLYEFMKWTIKDAREKNLLNWGFVPAEATGFIANSWDYELRQEMGENGYRDLMINCFQDFMDQQNQHFETCDNDFSLLLNSH